MSVGITDQPTTACSICRADASSRSHISRLMVITIYHPGVPYNRCIYMREQQHGRDSLSRAFMFIYTRRHSVYTGLRRSRVENRRTNERVRVKRETQKLRRARITVFKGRIIAICQGTTVISIFGIRP